MAMTDDEAYMLSEALRRIEQLEATQGRWRVNGADGFFQESGFRFGQRVDIGSQSIQILLDDPEAAASVQGVIFTRNFFPGEIDYDIPPNAYMIGILNNDAMTLYMAANYDDATPETSSTVATLVLESATGYGMVRIGPALYLESLTSDPASPFDGNVWFRSDTFKFRGRANGASDNFAMEAWVTAGFATAASAESYAHSLMLGGM